MPKYSICQFIREGPSQVNSRSECSLYVSRHGHTATVCACGKRLEERPTQYCRLVRGRASWQINLFTSSRLVTKLICPIHVPIAREGEEGPFPGIMLLPRMIITGAYTFLSVICYYLLGCLKHPEFDPFRNDNSIRPQEDQYPHIYVRQSTEAPVSTPTGRSCHTLASVSFG
jgi:hypothetical protein